MADKPHSQPASPLHDLLLHPVFLVALGCWLVNDHLLKQALPSWWTGKLSDAAGLVVAPICLAVLVRSQRASRARASTLLRWSSAVVAMVFTGIQLWPWLANLYAHVLGGVQWPWHAALALFGGEPCPALIPVVHTMDPTDVWMLPFAATGWILYRRRTRPHEPGHSGFAASGCSR